MKISDSINSRNLFNRLNIFTKKITKKLSAITLWLIFCGVCLYNIQNQDWNNPRRLIDADVHYYYIYAVSAIVYHDLDIGKAYKKLPGSIRLNLWLPPNDETGKVYSKMSIGLSLIYAPFTAFSHYILVPITGAPADGYSAPYKIGLLLSALLFFLFGLVSLRKVLLLHFNDTITTLTLIIVAFGTNITWYISSEATMSHVYSFALIIFLYRLLIRWFQNPRTGLSILIGIIFGLIVLIRPTNIMFLVLFLATGDIRERILFLFRNYAKILLMIAMFVVVWIPQFAFWKYVSGHWFFYTYGDESFFWNNPQVISSLFSYRKGWLVYTPLMMLAFIGLPVLWRQYRPLFWQVISVLILLTYINSSWWCWWFGGSYGNRAYIDGYGIFALAIAAFLSFIAKYRYKILSFTGIVVLAAFAFLNLFQTWQYRMGLIHYVSNTKQSYWNNFLKTQMSPEFYNNLVVPDHPVAMMGIYYPRSEMFVGDAIKIKSLIELHPEYFIRHFQGEAIKKISSQKKNTGLVLSDKIDSLSRIEAIEMYKALKQRYQFQY